MGYMTISGAPPGGTVKGSEPVGCGTPYAAVLPKRLEPGPYQQPVVPMRSLPLVASLALVSLALAGCIAGTPDDGSGPDHTDLDHLEVYEYRYTGDDIAVKGYTYGWMALVSNHGAHNVTVTVTTLGANATVCHATADGCDAAANGTYPLDVNGTALLLFQDPEPVGNTTGWSIATGDGHASRGFVRDLTFETGNARARPGDHVQTATVGVWVNGTSFYTNIADLDQNGTFPVGYDRETFDATPLPVYVYDESRTEQPVGSRDNCHFTTIDGYNTLLKTQAEHTTNVRWLAPEEAYTVDGAEDHFLYGDALVFLNTIVKHDGGTTNEDEAPDPTGECYDPRNIQRKIPTPPVLYGPATL